MVMEALHEDMGDGTMQCLDHPYKNHTPGGICAFCLQEKLGKLVSSSFPIAIFPSSSSSPSPSFRSDSALSVRQNASTNSKSNNRDFYHHQSHSRRVRIPFFPTTQRNDTQNESSLKRSKSTSTAPRRGGGGGGLDLMDLDDGIEYNSPRKRGFWSFLHLSKPRKIDKPCKEICYSSSTATIRGFPQRSSGETQRREEEFVDENACDSPNNQAAAARVSRSRSVGCGSRSFSGDFFERISTGFGDCTLRRVESQREGKPRATPARRHHGGSSGGQDCIKERVKCGGIFSGFMVASSSSSSSSSSYWVSSEAAAATPAAAGHLAHGRSKSWGWAFASPIRPFKPSSSGKREASNKNTTTPNLNAIPSLLTVGG